MPLLEPGDLIMDGGNSYFRGHRTAHQGARSARVSAFWAWASAAAKRARSGGRASCPAARPKSWDDRRARCSRRLPPRRPRTANRVSPIWGRAGAGHYVKMVHNGIEYGDMQLIAEAYRPAAPGAGAAAPPNWPPSLPTGIEGELDSFLIEITAQIFRTIDERDRAAAGRPGAGQGGAEGHRQVDQPGCLGHRRADPHDQRRRGRAYPLEHEGGARRGGQVLPASAAPYDRATATR